MPRVVSRSALPLPVAALRRRAHNAKSPKERHDTAYYAWEASIRLTVAARPPADAGTLAMPSIGHFVRAIDTRDARLDDPAVLAVSSLFSEVVKGKPDGSRSVTPRRLLDGVPAYRNQVLGHGSTRGAAFYDDAATTLVAGLDAAWHEGLFLAPGTKVVFVDSVEVGPDGTRTGRLLDLSDETPLVLDPRGTPLPEDVLPRRLWAMREDTFTPLHPWLLFRESELREQVLYFNGRGGSGCSFLDYVGGEALRGKALAEEFPSVEQDVVALLHAAPLTARAEEAPRDDQFGDYTLLGKLGEGGMGVVHLARQESLGRLVALKMLAPGTADDPVAVARFRREIQSLSRCDHPNVVKILTSGKRGDTHYYAMELIEGADLSEVAGALASSDSLDAAIATASSGVRKVKAAALADTAKAAPARPDPIAETGVERVRKLTRLFRDAALAVQALHDAGILHRDLKPGNLMVTATDHRVVVMDLGLAAIGDATQSITRDKSSLLGTLRYMPPEQLQRSLLDLDARADVYALAATFYELFTGRAFFDGETEAQLVTQVLHAAPLPARKANPTLPVDLAKILEKATQKDRALRYGTARELAQDIDALLAGRPVTARGATLGYRVGLAVRRNKVLAGAGAALVLAGSGATAFGFRRALQPHECTLGDAPDCTKQCDRGNATSCFSLGVMYAQASGVPKDAARAAELYRRACDGGDSQACYELGAALERGHGLTTDYDAARVRYGQACDAGRAQACDSLGIMLKEGRGGPKDLARAAKLYQQSCDGGYPNGCANLGVLYDTGEGVTRDAARARSLYDRACTAGSSSACGMLAVSLATKGDDLPRAAKLFETACNAGHAFACGGLGALVEDGRGAPKDPARAAKLYDHACTDGDAHACGNLGRLYAGGVGVAQDAVRAVSLFQRACDADDATGCALAGETFAEGRGVSKDARRAADFFGRACQAHDATSCARLIAGTGEPAQPFADPAEAKAMLVQLCKAGDTTACDAAAADAGAPPVRRPKFPKVSAKPTCRCSPGDPLCSCY